MQQHPMQGHPMIPAFATANITTEHIQKYLDENKQLILAILDNQNLGKLNECAQYQAKLQQNLMYLAAIADSQPQPPAAHSQMAPSASMQPSAHYMQHQQAQVAQSVMAGRLPLQYAPQQMPQEHQHQSQQQLQQQQLQHHQHQQALQHQLGMSAGGSNGLQMLHAEGGMGGNGALSRGIPDFGRGTSGNAGEGMQPGRGLGVDTRVGSKQDTVASENANPGTGDGHGSTAGHNADESEQMYLKASEEEGS
eukprot:TRINITY_DN6293_c0_g1_i1.p1 TRINITY_DN6293_c0_g1~~TRINITY_DN6293_c0_g1_i1.p1  ORF type:complete len:251 (-),score=76.79 TRINITY_DN6293_c0_g1_i1:402-1154(-)